MRFFRFRPLLDKFGPKKPKQTGKKTKQKQKKKKNHNCQFKLKFGTWKINGGVHSVLDSEHSFWENLVQKIKVVS